MCIFREAWHIAESNKILTSRKYIPHVDVTLALSSFVGPSSPHRSPLSHASDSHLFFLSLSLISPPSKPLHLTAGCDEHQVATKLSHHQISRHELTISPWRPWSHSQGPVFQRLVSAALMQPLADMDTNLFILGALLLWPRTAILVSMPLRNIWHLQITILSVCRNFGYIRIMKWWGKRCREICLSQGSSIREFHTSVECKL